MDHKLLEAMQHQGQSSANELANQLPSSNPLRLGVGAAGGGMAGAAIGSAIGGPVGAAMGAMVGGLLGACGGKEIARAVNSTDGLEAADEPDQYVAGAAEHDSDPAQSEYGQSRDGSAPAHEQEPIHPISWDNMQPGLDRLGGVIAPRDTDRGLRGGI